MLKKSGNLLSCSCHNVHSLPRSPASKTSLQSHNSLEKQHRRPRHHHHHPKLRWPEMTSARTLPTPYQIFDQRKGSPYSKQRFYELVKLYHPDRHDHDIASLGLSSATKLERYRLVVAANSILSDPVKRSAYDSYGAGWNGAPDVVKPRDASDSWGSYSGRGWGGGPQGPSQNATWEDWERWYQRDAKGPQEPRYASNSAFVGLIAAFAFIGGIGQFARAGSYGASFVEQRDALHNSIAKDLIRKRKESTSEYGGRDERIDSFLRQRDPIGYGVVDPKEESYRKALPPPEICSSEDIKQRPMEIYQQKSKPDTKDQDC